jgi:uncharacterized damage-inducible protein DinB
MYNTLIRQYQLVISSRDAVFAYLETLKPEDLLKPLATINNKCIGQLMAHNADTYIAWLVNFARQENRPYFNERDYQDLQCISATYEQVNLAVNDFLHHFIDALDVPLTLPKNGGAELTLSPLQIFTHVITHEFHHKGQVLNMSRQLGYTPVDTDVIRN